MNSWLGGIVEFIEQLTMWQELDKRVHWTVDYVIGNGYSSLMNSSLGGIVEFIEQLTMWQEMDNLVYWTVDYVTGDG